MQQKHGGSGSLLSAVALCGAGLSDVSTNAGMEGMWGEAYSSLEGVLGAVSHMSSTGFPSSSGGEYGMMGSYTGYMEPPSRGYHHSLPDYMGLDSSMTHNAFSLTGMPESEPAMFSLPLGPQSLHQS